MIKQKLEQLMEGIDEAKQALQDNDTYALLDKQLLRYQKFYEKRYGKFYVLNRINELMSRPIEGDW